MRGPPILDGYLRELHGLLHQRGEALAARLAQPGRAGVGEIADFLLLEAVNRTSRCSRSCGSARCCTRRVLYVVCLAWPATCRPFARSAGRRPSRPTCTTICSAASGR